MKRTTWPAASCWTAVAMALLATSAGGQIEEIVVTAQKRTESIQEVPLSITVLTGEDIEARGLYDAQELARQVPNFDLPRSNNMRNISVRIRGIGSSGTNAGIESSVGVFLDGLYMPSGAMSFGELADIQSYEILRGPQGTLYGRNTTGGGPQRHHAPALQGAREHDPAWRRRLRPVLAQWLRRGRALRHHGGPADLLDARPRWLRGQHLHRRARQRLRRMGPPGQAAARAHGQRGGHGDRLLLGDRTRLLHVRADRSDGPVRHRDTRIPRGTGTPRDTASTTSTTAITRWTETTRATTGSTRWERPCRSTGARPTTTS